ncbi:MAG: monovalent cation/H(+) antiporter subunit G [Acidimicrobiia bacterium]|nr:monovalent cation/H(+) antiporter subunit G [Acidimicrobiia bacterium]
MDTIVASVLICAGVALALVAGVGIVRFPNVFARMHAATKPATLGLILVAAGAAVEVGGTGNVTRLILVILLQVLTAPIAAHMVGRAAHRRGAPTGGDVDELADAVRSGDGPPRRVVQPTR